jgi:GntR family transcriptional regulator, transcriptional repressor for pyruvate dehydrogenase complex
MTTLQLFRPRQSDTIVSHIKNLIVQGILKPGDRIPPERDLASELGLGRGTIREAFHQLEALGLIDRAARSRVVRQLGSAAADDQDGTAGRTLEEERQFLLQVIDVRIGLEGWVAAEAARKATNHDVKRLKRVLARLEQAAGDAATLATVDLELHRSLVESTHNLVVMQVLESLTTMIRSIVAFKKLTLDPMRKVDVDLHRAIVDAVSRGDPQKAQSAMVAHLQRVRDAVAGLTQHAGGAAPDRSSR